MALNPFYFANSGIRRFRFGFISEFLNTTLIAGSPPVILHCLGASGDAVTPDADNQLYGMSPGHGPIVGANMFAGFDLLTRKNDVVSSSAARPQPDSFPGSGARNAGGRIPQGMKVTCRFFMTGFVPAVAELPTPPKIQTEVIQNRLFVSATGVDAAAVENPQGPIFLSSIRVAIQNIGAAGSGLAGVLVVNLEHTREDLPGRNDQSEQLAAVGASP